MPVSLAHRQRMLKHLEKQMNQHDFDNECCAFTLTMGRVTGWKESYNGALYRTRLVRHASPVAQPNPR